MSDRVEGSAHANTKGAIDTYEATLPGGTARSLRQGPGSISRHPYQRVVWMAARLIAKDYTSNPKAATAIETEGVKTQ
ncbi:unnamed protein product, partial [Iphiclides podalirius]